MKTAGRENPIHGVRVPRNRAHGAVGQNRSRSIKWAAKQEKFQPEEICFFLTSPFIELIRTWLRKPIKRWFFTKANEPSSVPLPQSDNVKTALTSTLISGVNIASYPRASPQTPCLRAGLGDDPEGPAKSTYVEVRWVDSVVEFFRLVSHQISLHPFPVVR
jgi:hypothetical protein